MPEPLDTQAFAGFLQFPESPENPPDHMFDHIWNKTQ